MNAHIQVDHRCEYNGELEKPMYEAITNLVMDQKVNLLIKPKIKRDWQDLIQEDIIDDLKKFKRFKSK